MHTQFYFFVQTYGLYFNGFLFACTQKNNSLNEHKKKVWKGFPHD